MSPTTEEGVVRAVCRAFRSDGYVVAREVPFMTKRIDTAAVRPRGRTVVAIEAKRADWMSGLSQALTYQLWAHKVYVAMVAGNAGGVDETILRRYGVGLLLVDGEVRTRIAPRISRVVAPRQAAELRARVLEAGHG